MLMCGNPVDTLWSGTWVYDPVPRVERYVRYVAGIFLLILEPFFTEGFKAKQNNSRLDVDVDLHVFFEHVKKNVVETCIEY